MATGDVAKSVRGASAPSFNFARFAAVDLSA